MSAAGRDAAGTLLVTGAQGFVGRWFVREAATRFARVVGVGRSPLRATFTHAATLGAHAVPAPLPAALRAAPDAYAYVTCDVRDEDALVALLRAERPRAIVHLASALRDDPPHALFPVNVEGTVALLSAAARSEVPIERIVLGSSGSVYGTPASLPVTEGDPLRPPDLYAVSKVAAELAAKVVAAQRGLPVATARIFNVVGPGLDERHACARFASQIAAIALGLAPPRVGVGDLTPTRDMVDVRDVATALTVLAERAEPGEAYNVASGREHTMRDVLDALLLTARLDGHVEIAREYHRSADCPRVVAGLAAAGALGYAPAFALRASLAGLYAYYADDVAAAVAAAGAPGA